MRWNELGCYSHHKSSSYCGYEYSIIIFLYSIIMFLRQLFTQLRSPARMCNTGRSYSSRESLYRPKSSPRGSYVHGAAARRSAGGNAGRVELDVMTVETPHLAVIGLAGAVSVISLCVLWTDVDESRRAKVMELIENENLSDGN